MKRTYIYVICWMIACLFLRGTLRAQEPAVVEIHVMPGAPAVVFKYQVKSGETVQVDWGDGKVEELSSPKDALQVIKHSYESYSGAAEGTIVSIKADHLLALEEPKAAQGLSKYCRMGATSGSYSGAFRLREESYVLDVSFSNDRLFGLS